jgi:PTS system N-acetylglucosamine-specific IIC component
MRTASRATLPSGTLPTGTSPTGTPPIGGHDAEAMLAALGGHGNVRKLETAAGRLLISTVRPELINEAALRVLGIRGIARPVGLAVQVLVAGGVEETAEPLRRLLGAA